MRDVKDSKKLSFLREKNYLKEIKIKSYFSIGISSVREIEKLNILQASYLSMKRAIFNLPLIPDLVLIDGNFSPNIGHKCKSIIKGDEK